MRAKGEAQDARAAAPESASSRFREAFAAMDNLVRRMFSDARPAFLYGMPGWVVPRLRPLAQGTATGTMDPDSIALLMVERARGLTLHVWDAAAPHRLASHQAALAQAGFRVMRGCVQYGRVGAFPASALVPLLEAVAKER